MRTSVARLPPTSRSNLWASAPSADFKRKNLVPIAGIAIEAAMVEHSLDERQWPVRKAHQD